MKKQINALFSICRDLRHERVNVLMFQPLKISEKLVVLTLLMY